MNKWIILISVIVIVLVGILGLFAASNNKKIVASSIHLLPFQKVLSTARQAPSIASPSAIAADLIEISAQTAQDYYLEFSECMKNPPTSASGQVSTYCQTNNRYAGKELATNLAKEYSPVICAQNLPQSVVVTGIPKLKSNKVSVELSEQFGAKDITDVTYQLQQEGDNWKVENIICP